MNILQSIFTDYYEPIIYKLHPRPSVIENVNKMIHCGDPSHGGAMYGCPHCGNLKFVPFRCKSRFCPSCGNKYNQLRSFHMSCKLVSCVHRHCVFTIPEKHFKMLRYYGVYAKHHKQEKKLRKCISAKKQRFLRSIQDWQHSILLSFGYDPLCCSECGTSMLVLEVYHKKTALFEQYRKVMKYG